MCFCYLNPFDAAACAYFLRRVVGLLAISLQVGQWHYDHKAGLIQKSSLGTW
jgi:hypothetical protein